MKLALNANAFVFDREIVALLLGIAEFKGSWKAWGNLAPERLAELRRIAAIESIASSIRIEGGKIGITEAGRIMQAAAAAPYSCMAGTFSTRDEQAAAGYALLLNEIYESWQDMPLSESVIRQMHRVLMQISDEDRRHCGEYKRIENNVAAFDRKGRQIGIVFETASALETPQLMDELIQWTNTQLIEKRLPALIVIAIFIVSFLAIHPFEDGNGRLSRALTMLLLLRAGYEYVPYSSLESVIEATKESYYMSLRMTQKTLENSEPDWNIWILYFLKTLAKQVRNLESIIKTVHLLRVLPETSLRILELIKAHGTLSISDAGVLLNVNKFTLRAHFKKLTADGYLLKVGKGPATRYALADCSGKYDII